MATIGIRLAEGTLAKESELLHKEALERQSSIRAIPEIEPPLRANIASYNSYPGIGVNNLSLFVENRGALPGSVLVVSSPQIKKLAVFVRDYKLHVKNEDLEFTSTFDLEEYSIAEIDGVLIFDHIIYPKFRGLSVDGIVEQILYRAINWNTASWRSNWGFA